MKFRTAAILLPVGLAAMVAALGGCSANSNSTSNGQQTAQTREPVGYMTAGDSLGRIIYSQPRNTTVATVHDEDWGR